MTIQRFYCLPLRWAEAAGAEEVPDGTRSRQLCIAGVEHHAEVFGDDCWLGAVLHLGKKNMLFFHSLIYLI